MGGNIMEESSNEEVLRRALYYESQYRNAILTDAISFYDANLTKDLIETDIFYKNSDGNIGSSLERIGMSAPCKFSDFINNWIENMVDPEYVKQFPFIKNIREFLINLYKEGKREYDVDYWIDSTKGNHIYINQSFLLTSNEYGEICALSIVKDHTKAKLVEEDIHKKELEQYAYYDPITSGYNYLRFKDKLRESNIPGSIISLDILSFKIINSICGIQKGDLVISEVWKLITKTFEFENGDMAGHINADRFIVFVPDFVRESIIRKIKNLTYALNILSMELSIPQLKPYYGISSWSPEKRIELAYSESVAAKSKAKQEQKINYAFFNEADTKRLIEEKQIIDDFEGALAKREFRIWYQPKFNPIDGTLVGAEALVRWIKSDGSMVSPGAFIPIFEKSGLIRLFDEYIFRNVCIQQRKWIAQNKKVVPVSVNLSRVNLYYKDIVEQYKKISEELEVDKKLLPIEITESAAVTNNEVKEIADAFYDAGFSLHMDDFGSGYSSLATLNVMHFETLKLDKSLVDYIGNFGGDRLLEHTVILAKELGMHVTAEGVENADQVAFLKHIGCDSIQGYFYSKPLPRDKYEKMLDMQKINQIPTETDLVTRYIKDFKRSIIKYPIYAFLINVTQDTFDEYEGSYDWRKETSFDVKKFTQIKNEFTEKFVYPAHKEAYLNFLDREKLLASYAGLPETRIFEYKRMYQGEYTWMRTLFHLFKVEGSDDLYAFQTVCVQ